ncbi:hypothetical protein [Sneathiella sp.]|uniref:hypothetical protein n=1 Tax=Sneathiella sp. TaxID=1964365 RepID=UPI003568BEEE
MLQDPTRQQSDLNIDDEAWFTESAEASYLVYSGDEEEANDNFPAHEVLQGCIWRDAASTRPQGDGAEREEAFEALAEDENRRTLDFTDAARGTRGFLDEETVLYDMPDP